MGSSKITYYGLIINFFFCFVSIFSSLLFIILFYPLLLLLYFFFFFFYVFSLLVFFFFFFVFSLLVVVFSQKDEVQFDLFLCCISSFFFFFRFFFYSLLFCHLLILDLPISIKPVPLVVLVVVKKVERLLSILLNVVVSGRVSRLSSTLFFVDRQLFATELHDLMRRRSLVCATSMIHTLSYSYINIGRPCQEFV